MKLLLISFLLLACAEAKLEFDCSVLYDMNDFHGTPEYPITFCDVGCRVYLTYPNDECPLGKCLGDQDNGPFTIELPNGGNQIKFIDLNRKKLADGQKAYFDVPVGTAQFIVRNPNGNGADRPLALWVVKNTAPSLSDLQVFDVADEVMPTKITTSASKIVLMSVAPFSATAFIDGDYSVVVKPSPFEMLDSDKCEYVYEIDNKRDFRATTGQATQPSFAQYFNSPLVSFGFDSKKFTMQLNTDHTFPDVRSIDFSGYLAGPGYIGCNNKSQVFNSESYNSGVTSFNETFYIHGTWVRHVSFYGNLNTDAAAPVVLYDYDTDKELRVTGTDKEKTSKWEYEMQTSSFAIAWDAELWRNETFMIRYTIDPTLTSITPKAIDHTATPSAGDATTSPSSLASMIIAVLSIAVAVLM